MAGYSSWRTELELSHSGDEEMSAAVAAAAATEVALALAGMPLTISRLRWPPGKAEMLNGPRSVIFAGADHVVLELLISGVADGRAGEDMKTVIMSMTVAVDAEADTRTVIVVGRSVIVFVLVRISIEVVVITSDLGKEGHTDDIWGGDTRESDSEVAETENGS